MWRVAAVAVAGLLAGCDGHDDKRGAPSAGPPAATQAVDRRPADPRARGAVPVATTGPSAAKTYDCGGKEQKPCPMQGWMKRVMAPASSSDDGEALAKALAYVAEHAPPGFPDWVAIAGAGAVKAKAGDVDGAKASCKQCHDAYKDRYKATMRDRPF